METSIDPWKLSLFSAILGGSFTLAGQLFSFHLQKKSKIKQDQAELNSLLMSFHVEIETVFERYINNVGFDLSKNTFPNGIHFRILANQDYTAVFTANAHRIGQIRSDSLRKSILQTYITTKSLLDSYASNNSVLDELLRMEKDLSLNPHMNTKLLEQQRQSIKTYGPTLYALHETYCQQVTSVLNEIKNHLS